MIFDDQFSTALERLRFDSQDKQACADIGSGYWTWLFESLGELIREKKDVEPFLSANSDLIDFGLHSSLVDPEQVRKEICNFQPGSSARLVVRTFSEWFNDLLLRIRQGDKKEQLERDIKLLEIQGRKLQCEIRHLQQERYVMLQSALGEISSSLKRQLENVEAVDKIIFESLKTKRAISKGTFFSVDQKREHVDREKTLAKEQQRIATLLNSISDKELVVNVKKMAKILEELFLKSVEIDESIKKMTSEAELLEKKSAEIPLLEIENSVRREIEYLRELVKLSSRRAGLEPFPLVRSGDKSFDFKTLTACLNQIMEFDPHIFHNDRVPLFGRPYILLVPGIGNAIYDWKNNCLILPIVAPSGNFIASLSSGIIEYRLDVDEDKKLLRSYNQIPELKSIRSIISLKSRMVKDYVVWMNSEYKGYRILSRDVKEWFEREIAPSKNEIYTPYEFQWYAISSTEFKKMLEDLESKIVNPENADSADLWAASILLYQQGNLDKAVELLKLLVEKQPNNLMAWYNLGLISKKTHDHNTAKHAFNIFCSLDPQSWWSRITRDHLREIN